MNRTYKNKKQIRKRIAALFLACILFFFGQKTGVCQERTALSETENTGAESTETEETLSLYATAAVLMDADSGRVLYEKNGQEFLANASTTKIMTCILALEYALPDEVVEISPYAAGMPKVKLYVKPGETYRLGDLLYSLMLESHNDSAVAIAEHIGSKALSLPAAEERTGEESKQAVAVFAGMMNEKAVEIGCENTWFITPNGLDATETFQAENASAGGGGEETVKEHGTTAEDLARIMAYCVKFSPRQEEFLKITQAESYSFSNQAGNRSFSCVNHNAFLHMMSGALSGKTGFTNKAGYCYVGALEQDGKCFTIALLACGWPNHKTYKWSDSKELFHYGLANFEYHGFDEVKYDESRLSPLPVPDGQTERIGQQAFVPIRLLENKDNTLEGVLLKKGEKIEVKLIQEKQLEAPVESGTRVGRVEYKIQGEIYKTDYIITTNTIKKIDYNWCFMQIVQKFVL